MVRGIHYTLRIGLFYGRYLCQTHKSHFYHNCLEMKHLKLPNNERKIEKYLWSKNIQLKKVVHEGKVARQSVTLVLRSFVLHLV